MPIVDLKRMALTEILSERLDRMRDNWHSRRLRRRFAASVEGAYSLSIQQNNSAAMDQIIKIVDEVESSLPQEKDIASLTRDQLPELEKGTDTLREGIGKLGEIARESSQASTKKQIVDCDARRDKRDLVDILSSAEERVSSIQVTLHLCNMDDREAAPHPLLCQYQKTSEIMYYVVSVLHDSANGSAFCPDLWARLAGVHNLGGKGVCWKYMEGQTTIEDSIQVIDFVNIAQRSDYMIAAINEEEKEIPVPIDIPRFDGSGAYSFGVHLNKLLANRVVLSAQWIGERRDANLLGISLDHSNFSPRKNEVYVKCQKRKSGEEIYRRNDPIMYCTATG